jgi:hypothetical protein
MLSAAYCSSKLLSSNLEFAPNNPTMPKASERHDRAQAGVQFPSSRMRQRFNALISLQKQVYVAAGPLQYAQSQGVVLQSRERIPMIEPLDKRLQGTSMRYGNEVRQVDTYFEDVPDITLSDEMIDLASHIIEGIKSPSASSSAEQQPAQSTA